MRMIRARSILWRLRGRRSVWIVQQDETPDNTVLGVFATMDQASRFAAEASREFPGYVIYSKFNIGYRYTDRSVPCLPIADA